MPSEPPSRRKRSSASCAESSAPDGASAAAATRSAWSGQVAAGSSMSACLILKLMRSGRERTREFSSRLAKYADDSSLNS